jgi:hypothetical protein
MAAFVDINPMNGVETWADGDESTRLQVHYRQDVEPIVERAKAFRNEGKSDEQWKRSGVALYASIPPVVVMELLTKYGINLLRAEPQDMYAAMKVIDRDYQFLKCTDRVHHKRNRWV